MKENLSSLTLSYRLSELIATIGVVFELIKTSTGGTEENDVARLSQLFGALDGNGKRGYLVD